MKPRFITKEQFEKSYKIERKQWGMNILEIKVYSKEDGRLIFAMMNDKDVVEQEMNFSFNVVQYVNGNKCT